jgi:hypothetical protein
MAIQCAITTIQGVELTAAHVNIANPQIIKTRPINATQATATAINIWTFYGNASIYASTGAYQTGNPPIEGFPISCQVDLDKNVLVQAYAALKTNPRLSKVTDC